MNVLMKSNGELSLFADRIMYGDTSVKERIRYSVKLIQRLTSPVSVTLHSVGKETRRTNKSAQILSKIKNSLSLAFHGSKKVFGFETYIREVLS